VKYNYKITFVSASGVEDGSFVHLAWKRGSKSSNHGETESKEAQNGSVDWNETITIPCTLFKSSSTTTGFDPKEISLTLTMFDLDKKKDVILGKIIVDLTTFADSKEPQTKYHNVKPAKKITSGPFCLTVTYAPELVGEGGEDEPISETDAGAVSDEDEEPDTPSGEDAAAAETAAAASTVAASSTPKKLKSSGRRGKKSSSSGLIVTPARDPSPNKGVSPVIPNSSSNEKLADVIRERDELRQALEKSKKHHHGSSSGGEVDTMQKQISTLRSQNTELEQTLADTREELAVKTSAEERITAENKDAQEQLAKLRATMKDGGNVGDDKALISALEARILALESERDSLKKELESQTERYKGKSHALHTRVGDLEASLDQAKSHTKIKSEDEVLQKQNTQLTKKWEILNSLFDGIKNVNFTSSGKPTTSKIIVDFLRRSGQPDEPVALTALYEAVQTALKAPMKDFRVPLLWVSTLHYALLDLGNSVATIPAPEVVGSEQGKNAAEVLTQLLVRAFSKTLELIYHGIEPACRYSFISASSDSNNAVITSLIEISNATKELHLAPSIRKQLMSQIVYDIDATVFNILIKDKSLCSCDRVLKIRQAMSSVERWLLKDSEIASAKRQLQLVREVANLFMMDSSVLTDDEAMKAAFSALNIRQIACLLDLFKPDDLKQESIDPALIRDLKVKAADAGDKAPLEVDGHKWFNLPKPKDEEEEKKKTEKDDE